MFELLEEVQLHAFSRIVPKTLWLGRTAKTKKKKKERKRERKKPAPICESCNSRIVPVCISAVVKWWVVFPQRSGVRHAQGPVWEHDVPCGPSAGLSALSVCACAF